MFQNKKVKVILSEEANQAYEELNKVVGDELKKNVINSEHQTLLNSLKRSFDLLKDNPFAGTQIQKSLIPKRYVEVYDVNNLWKFNLSNYWRLIYTVKGKDVEILAFVVDMLNHKNYNKVFGYNKK